MTPAGRPGGRRTQSGPRVSGSVCGAWRTSGRGKARGRVPAGYGGGIGSAGRVNAPRSEEHTSELQSLMRISYAVFCLKKKKDREQESRQELKEECNANR